MVLIREPFLLYRVSVSLFLLFFLGRSRLVVFVQTCNNLICYVISLVCIQDVVANFAENYRILLVFVICLEEVLQAVS